MAKRKVNNGRDDEIGDIYDDSPWWKLDEVGVISAVPPWCGEKPDKRKNGSEEVARPKQHEFKLAHHHVLCYEGYGHCLVPGDPTQRRGFPVLCSPGGFPVARLHGDLKEGEVSWVLR